MTRAQLSRRSLTELTTTASGVVTNAGVAFLVTWMVGRGLGAEGAGYFFLLTSVFLITVAALGMGADTGLVRALSRAWALEVRAERSYLASAAVPVLVLGALLTAAVVLRAEDVAALLGLDDRHVGNVRFLALFLVPATLTSVLLGACRGLGRLHVYTAVQNLTIPVLRCAGVGVVLVLAPGLGRVTAAWAAPLAVSAVLAGIFLRRALAPGTWHVDRDHAADFWRFAAPRGVAVLVERAIEWVDVLLVIHLLGPAAGGVYGVVSRCAMAGQFLESALRIVVGPRISTALALDDDARVGRLFDLVTRALILALWPFYLVLGLFSDRVLSLFGAEFTTGATALSVVCLAMLCAVGAGMVQTFLLMAGRSHWQLTNRSIQLVVIALLAYALVPDLGLLGAGVAWACGLLADTTLAMRQVSRTLRVRARLRSVVGAAAVPLLVFGIGGAGVRWATAESSVFYVLAALLGLSLCYVVVVLALRHRLGLPLHRRHKERQ